MQCRCKLLDFQTVCLYWSCGWWEEQGIYGAIYYWMILMSRRFLLQFFLFIFSGAINDLLSYTGFWLLPRRLESPWKKPILFFGRNSDIQLLSIWPIRAHSFMGKLGSKPTLNGTKNYIDSEGRWLILTKVSRVMWTPSDSVIQEDKKWNDSSIDWNGRKSSSLPRTPVNVAKEAWSDLLEFFTHKYGHLKAFVINSVNIICNK
jgi:hypothetical protein